MSVGSGLIARRGPPSNSLADQSADSSSDYYGREGWAGEDIDEDQDAGSSAGCCGGVGGSLKKRGGKKRGEWMRGQESFPKNSRWRNWGRTFRS